MDNGSRGGRAGGHLSGPVLLSGGISQGPGAEAQSPPGQRKDRSASSLGPGTSRVNSAGEGGGTGGTDPGGSGANRNPSSGLEENFLSEEAMPDLPPAYCF